jgi:hypothetical protein
MDVYVTHKSDLFFQLTCLFVGTEDYYSKIVDWICSHTQNYNQLGELVLMLFIEICQDLFALLSNILFSLDIMMFIICFSLWTFQCMWSCWNSDTYNPVSINVITLYAHCTVLLCNFITRTLHSIWNLPYNLKIAHETPLIVLLIVHLVDNMLPSKTLHTYSSALVTMSDVWWNYREPVWWLLRHAFLLCVCVCVCVCARVCVCGLLPLVLFSAAVIAILQQHSVVKVADLSLRINCIGIWPPLWSSVQSSWLQIQRPWFDSRFYPSFWVVGLERDPLSLVNTIEELLGRKDSDSGLESREYGSRYPQQLALTLPTIGSRLFGIARLCTQATEFKF